jgi:peptidoglycan/LPS O-acetylase OafA/YrhL
MAFLCYRSAELELIPLGCVTLISLLLPTMTIIDVPTTGGIVSVYLILVLFCFAVSSRLIKRILSNLVLLVIGFISYPLYLLHENVMIALIVKIGYWAPWLPSRITPFIPIALIGFTAYVIARYGEPLVRRVFREITKRVAFWLKVAAHSVHPAKTGDAAPNAR